MLLRGACGDIGASHRFQWAPTLGGECYISTGFARTATMFMFQWAPTLGGECYNRAPVGALYDVACFNGHPPLGVNATTIRELTTMNITYGFNGHPPLGVNATCADTRLQHPFDKFQWAPTLGGECYFPCPYNTRIGGKHAVSMGTHPWG